MANAVVKTQRRQPFPAKDRIAAILSFENIIPFPAVESCQINSIMFDVAIFNNRFAAGDFLEGEKMPSKEAGTIKFRLAKVPILKPHSNGECNKQCILFYVCPFVKQILRKKTKRGIGIRRQYPAPIALGLSPKRKVGKAMIKTERPVNGTDRLESDRSS